MSLDDNTMMMQSILDIVRALPEAGTASGPVYGNAVFFGDSVPAGAANEGGRSYVDILSESGIFTSVTKLAYSGATIGPYSYDDTTNSYCLINQIENNQAAVRNAEIIFCHYEGNDVNALLNGRVLPGTIDDTVDHATLCGYTKKAIERIYQLNPTVRIIWLAVAQHDYAMLRRWCPIGSDNERDVDGYILFHATALQVARMYSVSIIDAIENFNYGAMTGSDGSHPGPLGHQCIAENILHNMFRTTHYIVPERPVRMTLTNDPNTYKPQVSYADGKFQDILVLIWSGVHVPIYISVDGASLFKAEVSYITSTEIGISCTTVYNGIASVLGITWTWTGGKNAFTAGYY